MATDNNVRLLLFICCNVAISFHLATSQLSPETSPSPQPDISSPPTLSPSPGPAPVLSPSPGPAPGPAPISHVSYPPSTSESISPTTEGPTAFDYLIDFDISPMPSSFDANPLVQEICESTDYPSLCIATVAPHLDGKPDLPSVLQVAVKAGISIARHAFSVAKEIDEKQEDPELAAILHDSFFRVFGQFVTPVAHIIVHKLGKENPYRLGRGFRY